MKHSLLFTFMFCTFFICAQNNSYDQNQDVKSIKISEDLQTASQILLKENSPSQSSESKALISQLYELHQDEIVFKNENKLGENILIEKYERYINKIRVPHGVYIVHKKNNRIESLYAEHYTKDNLRNSKNLSESKALEQVLPLLGSDLFAWESTKQLMSFYDKNSTKYKLLEKALLEDYPVAELVYVKDFYQRTDNLELAYLFTIESVAPEFRDRVYVSAEDGRILLRDPQLKHGSGDTRYSGSKSFPTTEITGPSSSIYELKGIEPISGVYCETRSLEGLGGLPISSPAIAALSDSIADGDELDPCAADSTYQTDVEVGDDIWNYNEHRKVPFDGLLPSCCPAFVAQQCDEVKNDDVALDAHWGAATVARYWKDIHDRFGYDNNGASINSYVHHGQSYENATWNGMIMKYGDGAYQDGNNPAAMFGPLVSLDVCAHEIGHAICTSTSDLVYSGESGAMNEGLSDIWGATTEAYVLDSIDGTLGYLIWAIGEQIDERDTGLYNEPDARAIRWMDHPPAESNPDTYGAGMWWQDPDCASPSIANDFCGIHFNSGVLNKWFYLLTEGSGNALSPGLNKPAFDDEINDKGHVYSVDGIGIRKSEVIIYGANLLLSPNSKFADMRAASIDIARSLFGPCSNEVEQTIKAWYAVGVGANFGNCLPTIEFNQFNIREVSERSTETGCMASKDINLGIFSYMTTATITFTTQGNAVDGEDYELCFTSLDFVGSEEKLLKITIFDDKLEEENDTIIINFSGGGHSDSDTVIIINDDGVAAIGSLETIFSETFDIDDNSWQKELVNPTSMLNDWFIDAGNTNQAHISFAPNNDVPKYVQQVESHVRLKSPVINGIGRKNIIVNFDYIVAGERDLVDTLALFDFGSFEISQDGNSWEEIDLFVGTAATGGNAPDTGQYSLLLPQLENSDFQLGFTWHNDALNGSVYSFMVDNVIVTGEGLEIESDVGDSMEAVVPQDMRVGFISDNDNEVIATIETAKDDLGCTNISLTANSQASDYTSSICKLRSEKVFKITTEHASDSIQLTLYFKESEIDDWDNFLSLNVLTVEGVDIDDELAGFSIIDNSKLVIDDQTSSGDGFVTYSFWIPSTVMSIALTDRSGTPEELWVKNSSDSDLESFRDAVTKACEQDTIKFVISTNNMTISLDSSILIEKDLYIMGNGIFNTKVFNNSGPVLQIDAGVNIYLENLHFQSTDPFLPVNNDGNVTIVDTVLINN